MSNPAPVPPPVPPPVAPDLPPRRFDGMTANTMASLRAYLRGSCHLVSNPILGSDYFMYLRHPDPKYSTTHLKVCFMPDSILLAFGDRMATKITSTRCC